MTRPLAVLALLGALAACQDATAPLATPSEPALNATPYMERIFITQDEVFPTPRGCTGEPIAWHLREVIDYQYTIDSEGGLHGTLRFHDEGSWGVGLVTGVMYRLQTIQAESFQFNSSGTQIDETAIFLRRFISQGSLENFRVNNRFHFTVDANGNLTSYYQDVDRVCN